MTDNSTAITTSSNINDSNRNTSNSTDTGRINGENQIINNNKSKPKILKLKINDNNNALNHTTKSLENNSETLTTTPIEKPTKSKPKPKPVKKKHRDKSDLGEDFVAPDGGWGWLVAIAAGLNILVTFAVAQQFGIIFRQRMLNLGISSSQLTTIINVQVAVSALTGLLNGPVFRRYSYRQVALFGSILTFMGLFSSVFAASFLFYICSFSVIYGFGRGLTVSASSLAVNTFFKQKRRTATAYEFGVAGMGPIFLPYLATFLLMFYGVQGTVLIFSAVSLHTIACSLIYQPVKWHVKKVAKDSEAINVFVDEEDEHGTIAEPDTPTLSRANDGWYGSRTSINTLTYLSRRNTIDKTRETSVQKYELRRLSSRDSGRVKPRSISISLSIKEEDHDHIDEEHDQNHDLARENDPLRKYSLPTIDHRLTYATEEDLHGLTLLTKAEQEALLEQEKQERKKLPFYKKVVIFFDLDLLRDFTYVNLAVGLTLINFVEINFAILTPFILSDFGFKDSQIALAMSSLGFCDLVIRFLIPLITAKMTFSNKTFFIVGILGMCIGRFLLSFTRNFYLMIAIFLWMGLNKAFRTVFWSLIIPSYVPLKRLPAAAGLQLLMSGVFSLGFGPIIGLIRDNTDFAVALHVLNSLCLLAIVMWTLEDIIRSRQKKPNQQDLNK